MITDTELLRRYVSDGDEASFAELVRRHLNHVYSTALRLVNGDTHLAEDVAQTVFTDLSRKASTLRECSVLSSWLHTSARFAAAKFVRSEQRRRQREKITLPMPEPPLNSDPDWEQVRPFLDETIGELGPAERDALLLRFFENKPFAQIGSALGLSENAARMRVERAIEKLRARLALRGITSTTVALGTAMAQFTIGPVPANLHGQILGRTTATFLAPSSLRPPAISGKLMLVATLVFTTLVLVVALKWKSAPRSAIKPTAGAVLDSETVAAATNPVLGRAESSLAKAQSPATRGLVLFFLDAQTGQAITNQPIGLKGWVRGSQTMVEKSVVLEEGRCIAPFEQISGRGYWILTHIDGYADVQLRWKLSEEAMLPESYFVRLVRPALIAGKVVDSGGNSVSGAEVGFNTENVAADALFTEDHCVDYLRVKTDLAGSWRVDRLAPEMVGRIFGSASHPDHSPSEMIHVSRKPELIPELLNGTFVFRLGAGVIVSGRVVDPNGRPIPAATVRVGRLSTSKNREVKTEFDGAFRISGCTPGDGIVSVEAEGFAPTALALNVTTNLPPLQIILGEGAVLRLRVTDVAGNPVPGASLTLDSFPRSGRSAPVPLGFVRFTGDADGRIVWPHAPAEQLPFNLSATGYLRRNDLRLRPSDEEHVLTLERALTITGTVRDAVTGELIPRFRLGIGSMEQTVFGAVEPRWSTLDRFWRDFTGGKFRHTLQEPVLGNESHPTYVFRFQAEGHAPFVTRAYQTEEGEVQIEATLQPVEDVIGLVYGIDGKLASDAQVGLMIEGTDAQLVPGGFAGELGHSLAWVRRADAQGRFTVPAGEKIDSLVVANSSGFAEMSLDELRRVGVVRLRPWARVEGILQREGNPVPNVKLGLRRVQGSPLQLGAFETTAGADGRFIFPKAPPGMLQIYDRDFHGPGKLGTVEARCGETNQAQFSL